MKSYNITDKNFSKDFFGNAPKKKMLDNVDKLVTNVTIKSKDKKYVPIATGKTMSSIRKERLGSSTWRVSSIDWGGQRYTGPGNATSYYARAGYGFKVYVPAGKNKGKNRWFERAHNDLKNSGKMDKILNDIY